MSKEEIKKLEDIMLQLGEVHNMVARTGLTTNDYTPISEAFAKAKVELYNLYNELKNQQSK